MIDAAALSGVPVRQEPEYGVDNPYSAAHKKHSLPAPGLEYEGEDGREYSEPAKLPCGVDPNREPSLACGKPGSYHPAVQGKGRTLSDAENYAQPDQDSSATCQSLQHGNDGPCKKRNRKGQARSEAVDYNAAWNLHEHVRPAKG